jgi:hypothetical protein
MAGKEKRRSTEQRNTVTMAMAATQDSTFDWRELGAQVTSSNSPTFALITLRSVIVMTVTPVVRPGRCAPHWLRAPASGPIDSIRPSDRVKTSTAIPPRRRSGERSDVHPRRVRYGSSQSSSASRQSNTHYILPRVLVIICTVKWLTPIDEPCRHLLPSRRAGSSRKRPCCA